MVLDSDPNDVSPLNIVHINNHDWGGGTDIAANDLHRQLRIQGHNSQFIVKKKLTDDQSVQEILPRRGPPGLKRLADHMERRFGYQYLYSPSFRKVQEQFPERVDVLHLHCMHGSQGYADIGHLPNLAKQFPLVLSLQDMFMLTGHCGYGTGCDRWKTGCGQCPDLTLYPSIPVDGTRFNWRRKRRCLAKCKGIQVTACSQWLADEARKCPIFDSIEIHTVMNAADLSVFCPGDRQAARQRFNLPAHETLILVCANDINNPWKGAADAIEAINRLPSKSNPTVRAVFVGQKSDSVSDQLSIPCTTIDRQSDRSALADIYRAADLLLMPSTEEAFGLVAAEALGCGVPVVAYATGGLAEVVDDTVGRSVRTHDRERLSVALNELIDDRALRESLGRYGVERCRARFSMENQAREFLEIYAYAMNRFDALRS